MSDNTKKITGEELQKFEILVGRYTNKAKGQDFATYEGYIGKRKQRITVKFRRDVENIPTESGYITVKVKDLSKDTRAKYPVLWVHAIHSFERLEDNKDYKAINELFNESDLPF